jgi:hypothetical protein
MFKASVFIDISFYSTMPNPEFQSQIPEVRRAITDVDGLYVPDYDNYGTGAGLDAHLAQLAQESDRGAYSGLSITRHPVGPRDKDFTKTVFNFDEPGFTATVFVRPHGDEPLGLLVAERLANVARYRRELLVSRGVGRIAVFDVTSEDSGNDWHFDEHTLGNYIRGSNRGTDHDWRYPNESNTFTNTTPHSEAGRQVLDEERPRVLDSQHNANIGSYWAYIENGPPGLARAQSELMLEVNDGLPPSPPDDPDVKELAEGVYKLHTWAEMVPIIFGKNYTQEQLSAYSDNPIHYAGREYGTIGVLYEQALFTYAALSDNEPARQHYEALDTALRKGIASVVFVKNVLDRKRLQEDDPGYPLYTQIRSSVTHWQEELLPEHDRLQTGDAKDYSTVLTGAQVANLLVRKLGAPAKLLGSLTQLTEIDDSFSPFKTEVTDRINEETGYLEDKLGLTAARPSRLVRAKLAAFLLTCESA